MVEDRISNVRHEITRECPSIGADFELQANANYLPVSWIARYLGFAFEVDPGTVPAWVPKDPAGSVTSFPYSLVSMAPSPVVSKTSKIISNSASEILRQENGDQRRRAGFSSTRQGSKDPDENWYSRSELSRHIRANQQRALLRYARDMESQNFANVGGVHANK